MTPADAALWTAEDRGILRKLATRLRRKPGQYTILGQLIIWQLQGTSEPVSPVPSDDGHDLDDLQADRITAEGLRTWWPIIPAPKGPDA